MSINIFGVWSEKLETSVSDYDEMVEEPIRKRNWMVSETKSEYGIGGNLFLRKIWSTVLVYLFLWLTPF